MGLSERGETQKGVLVCLASLSPVWLPPALVPGGSHHLKTRMKNISKFIFPLAKAWNASSLLLVCQDVRVWKKTPHPGHQAHIP